MSDKKNTVVVLSRNYSTGLSVIRSLGEAGYTVDLVASAYKAGASEIAASSKFVRKYTEVVSKKVQEDEEENGLVKALLTFAEEEDGKSVIFPTDDYTTSIMDKYRSELEDHFIMPTIVGGGDGCLTERMDKTWQANVARAAGLLTPLEWIIPLSGKIVIPSDMIYPCFCKPIESVTGYKKEMARCNNRKELRNHLKNLQSAYPNRSILVQEFLKIDNEIDMSGVCLNQEIIIPAIIKKWNVAKYEKGVTLAGKIVPFEELGELCEKIKEMLRQFHYVGMFDMELNIVGDKIYFNEVNLRSGGPNFSYFRSGVNLPALFVKEALGEKHTEQEACVEQYGKSFLYEKVAWEDYIHGYMTKQELDDRIKAADITLLNYAPDPKPGEIFMHDMKAVMQKAKKKAFRRSVRNSPIYKSLKRTLRNVKRFARNTKRKIKKMISSFKKTMRYTFRPCIAMLRQLKYMLLSYPQTKAANRRQPFAEKTRVLVAGRNYCSNLCMARSLGQAGYDVEVMRLFQVRPKKSNLLGYLKPDAYSRYIKAYHVCVSHRKPENIVKRLIEIADPYRKMLLIPCDDLVAAVADEHYKQLSQYYVMPNVAGREGKLARLMSKSVQKKLAISAGLPIINSCTIRSVNGKFRIPETVNYPCFIKPNVSKNSSKGRMRRCDSREELHSVLKKYCARKDFDILVEDFIDIGREYSILGLSTQDGVVAPGFFGVLEGGHGPHRGVAMTGELLPAGEHQQLIDDICAFISTLRFDGLFDVDLIEDKNGKMYFVELNLRYGASGYAVTESGANLPGMFADYMLAGKPIDMDCKVNEYGKPFISEKIMIDEFANGYISAGERDKQFKNAAIHFVYNKDDKAAYNHFKKFYPLAAIMRAHGKDHD